jgi:hypothetical protein
VSIHFFSPTIELNSNVIVNQGHPGACPTCHEKVPKDYQYVKNYMANDTVELFMEALRSHGHPSWQEGKDRARREWQRSSKPSVCVWHCCNLTCFSENGPACKQTTPWTKPMFPLMTMMSNGQVVDRMGRGRDVSLFYLFILFFYASCKTIDLFMI